MKVPQEVKDWVKTHKGSRSDYHAEGHFKQYKDSKSSMCWGNNGIETENYFIATCQPSPSFPSYKAFFYYDFQKKS